MEGLHTALREAQRDLDAARKLPSREQEQAKAEKAEGLKDALGNAKNLAESLCHQLAEAQEIERIAAVREADGASTLQGPLHCPAGAVKCSGLQERLCAHSSLLFTEQGTSKARHTIYILSMVFYLLYCLCMAGAMHAMSGAMILKNGTELTSMLHPYCWCLCWIPICLKGRGSATAYFPFESNHYNIHSRTEVIINTRDLEG